jgi:hypothetical protein
MVAAAGAAHPLRENRFLGGRWSKLAFWLKKVKNSFFWGGVIEIS